MFKSGMQLDEQFFCLAKPYFPSNSFSLFLRLGKGPRLALQKPEVEVKTKDSASVATTTINLYDVNAWLIETPGSPAPTEQSTQNSRAGGRSKSFI